MGSREKDFLPWLASREVTFASGAWGSTCGALGLGRGALPEIWNLRQPESVADIARAHARAGVDLLSTNTFNGNAFRMPDLDAAALAEVNRQGVVLVREELRESQRVYGAMGPSGLRSGDPRFLSEEHAAAFLAQAEALISGGADALGLETMLSVAEAAFLVRVLKTRVKCAVMCAFTYSGGRDGLRTLCGHTPVEAAAAMAEAGADVLGVNCCAGPEEALSVLKAYGESRVGLPLWASPNAGLPGEVDGKLVYPVGPVEFARWLSRLAEGGATIVGGCCGAGPAYSAQWRR